jgi:hypothetical protein
MQASRSHNGQIANYKRISASNKNLYKTNKEQESAWHAATKKMTCPHPHAKENAASSIPKQLTY